jgi:tetratricopeptide (TPR) repeat protein
MNRMIVAKMVIVPSLILTACMPNDPNLPSQATKDGSINSNELEKSYEKNTLKEGGKLVTEDKTITWTEPEKSYEKGDTAEKYYNRGIDEFYSGKKRSMSGDNQGKIENYNSAIRSFDQAMMLRRDFPQAYFGRGRARYQSGDEECGIKDYKRAVEIYKEQGTNREAKDYHDVRLFLADAQGAKMFEQTMAPQKFPQYLIYVAYREWRKLALFC